MSNREWVFRNRPKPSGFELSDFELRSCAVPSCGDGELLIAAHLLSVDPTMYAPPARTAMCSIPPYTHLTQEPRCVRLPCSVPEL
jgi:NADPH-dependent curcumin reductase CurA